MNPVERKSSALFIFAWGKDTEEVLYAIIIEMLRELEVFYCPSIYKLTGFL